MHKEWQTVYTLMTSLIWAYSFCQHGKQLDPDHTAPCRLWSDRSQGALCSLIWVLTAQTFLSKTYDGYVPPPPPTEGEGGHTAFDADPSV